MKPGNGMALEKKSTVKSGMKTPSQDPADQKGDHYCTAFRFEQVEGFDGMDTVRLRTGNSNGQQGRWDTDKGDPNQIQTIKMKMKMVVLEDQKVHVLKLGGISKVIYYLNPTLEIETMNEDLYRQSICVLYQNLRLKDKEEECACSHQESVSF
jgi:hypothetical protein